MKIASPLLKRVVYPGLFHAGYFRRGAGPDLAVLTYHGVLPAEYTSCDPGLDDNLVTAKTFRDQLRFLKDRYNVISPREFLLWCERKHQLPRRSVLLTCDDGLRNTLTDMLPVLQEFQISCLFFVTGASLSDAPAMLWYEELYLMLLGAPESFRLNLPEIEIRASAAPWKGKRELWWKLVRGLSRFSSSRRRQILAEIRTALGIPETWDRECRQNPPLARRFMTLTLTELQRMIAAGMFIGAHTSAHPVLSETSLELATEEICDCRDDLERALGQEIWALAYPFGDASSVTARELRIARDAGFKCAFANAGGSITSESNLYALPRLHVTASMTPAELEAHISGLQGSLRSYFSFSRRQVAF